MTINTNVVGQMIFWFSTWSIVIWQSSFLSFDFLNTGWHRWPRNLRPKKKYCKSKCSKGAIVTSINTWIKEILSNNVDSNHFVHYCTLFLECTLSKELLYSWLLLGPTKRYFLLKRGTQKIPTLGINLLSVIKWCSLTFKSLKLTIKSWVLNCWLWQLTHLNFRLGRVETQTDYSGFALVWINLSMILTQLLMKQQDQTVAVDLQHQEERLDI